MKAEINFFQDGIARRIADEYLGLARCQRTLLAFGAITIMELSLSLRGGYLRFSPVRGLSLYCELFIDILCVIKKKLEYL